MWESTQGLVGTFGCGEGDGPFCGVLALGGSEGGIPEGFMQLLVKEGFACLALAYFNTPDTQPALMEGKKIRKKLGTCSLLFTNIDNHDRGENLNCKKDRLCHEQQEWLFMETLVFII